MPPVPFENVSFAVNGTKAWRLETPKLQETGSRLAILRRRHAGDAGGSGQRAAPARWQIRGAERGDSGSARSLLRSLSHGRTPPRPRTAKAMTATMRRFARCAACMPKSSCRKRAGTPPSPSVPVTRRAPALLTGRNVEVFATLTGKRSKVGSIVEIFGPDGFGRMLRPFQPAEIPEGDANLRAAEQRVEQARHELAKAGLALHCTPEKAEQGRSAALEGGAPA